MTADSDLFIEPAQELNSLGQATGVEAETDDGGRVEGIHDPFDPEKIDVITRTPNWDRMACCQTGHRASSMNRTRHWTTCSIDGGNMSLLVFLNELSYQDVDSHREEVATALDGVVTLLREIRRHRLDTALVTDAEFMNLGIGAGFSMRQRQTDGRNREAMRFSRALRNKLPPGILPVNKADDTIEYTHNGSTAFGLGAAHINEGLGVSLSLSTVWDAPRLLPSRSAPVENDTGDMVLVCTDEEVRRVTTRPIQVAPPPRYRSTPPCSADATSPKQPAGNPIHGPPIQDPQTS